MNKILAILFASLLIVSCGQQAEKSGNMTAQDTQEITVGEFLADASPLVDKPVNIDGTVVHVCRHGGQRLFMIGEDGEERIRITTGEDIAEFDVTLEGEKIVVTGIVRELIINETYLAEWEAEVLEGSKHDRGEGHEGGVGHGDNHGDSNVEDNEDAQQIEQQLVRIQEVRDEIAASGKDHLSDYWIETIEFKVINE